MDDWRPQQKDWNGRPLRPSLLATLLAESMMAGVEPPKGRKQTKAEMLRGNPSGTRKAVRGRNKRDQAKASRKKNRSRKRGGKR
jgi:hypothetical protein